MVLAPVFSTCSACGKGFDFAAVVNCRSLGLTARTGWLAAVSINVTLIACGDPPAPDAVTVTVP